VKVDFNILGLPAFLVGVPRQLAGRVFRSKLFSLKNSQKDGFTQSGSRRAIPYAVGGQKQIKN